MACRIHNHPNPPINGIFQTDMNSKQISHRQIPFGPTDDGGACHGMAWQNGKLWVSSNRLESLVRAGSQKLGDGMDVPAHRAARSEGPHPRYRV